MTTSPPATRPHDDDAFEAEVRAMLIRRAGDVSPSTGPVDIPTGRRALDVTHLTVVPAAATPFGVTRRPRPRVVAAAAAVVVLAAVGAGTVLTHTGGQGSATETGPAQADPTAAPIIWPLTGDVPADVLSAPDTASASYLLSTLGASDASLLEAPVVDGPEASVGYTVRGVHGEVALRRADGRWGVTAATSDAVEVTDVRSHDASIEVGFRLADVAQTGMQVRVTTVAADGSTAVGNTSGISVLDSGSIEVVEPGPDGGVTTPGDDAEVDGAIVTPDVPPGWALVLDADPSSPPVAVRVDLLADHDGDPGTPDVVIGHASRATTAAAVSSPAAPAVPPPTSAPDDIVAPSPTAAAVTPPAANAGTVTSVEGTFRGDEHFGFTTGRCPDLDHVLDSTFTLSDGTTWQYHSDYCGTLHGDDLWSGAGTFAFTLPTGDTLSGAFTSEATLPTEGEPLYLTITGGTGAHAGASGTCSIDNNLRAQGQLGSQEHHGSFTCEIVGAAP